MAAPPVLEVSGLVKTYPGVRALGGVDFDVRAGEVHCIVGPNGAGKSTLIKCIAGSIAPTAGEIRIDGELLVRRSLGGDRRGVATIYQELDLVGDLTGRGQHLPRPRAAGAWASSIAGGCGARRPSCCSA